MLKVVIILLLAGGLMGCTASSLDTADFATAPNTQIAVTQAEVAAPTIPATAAETAATATPLPTAAPPATATAMPPATIPEATMMLETESVSPTTEIIEELMPTMEPPANAAVQQWISQAKEDLAGRLDVKTSAIEFVSFEEKVWPNPGMGCPHPDMRYKQVPVDGYLIRLRVGQQLYNYHGGGGRPPFLCENKIFKEDSFVPPPGFDT